MLQNGFRILQPLAGFFGGVFGGVLTFIFAGGLSHRVTPERLVLSGVAVSALAIALVRFTFVLDDDITQQVITWMTGTITDVRWHHVQQLGFWSLGGIIALWLLAYPFNLLALGNELAQGVGLNATRYIILGSLVAVVLVAICVGVIGPILFIGLVVPHLCRLLFGSDYRILVPSCALLGATLMCFADVLSKYIFYPSETSVGIVASFLGGIYFLVLVKQGKHYDK